MLPTMISNLFNVCYNDKMMKYAPTSNLTMTTPYSPEVVFVPLCPLGKGPATKSDEFLLNFPEACDPPHIFGKLYYKFL